MKSIITISVIVFMSLTTTLHAQWFEVDSPTSKDITDIHFADSENGFMSCVLGTVLKTTNGGLDWQAFNTEIRATFMSVFGIDKDTVYTARVSLYKSTNSCVSWADYGGLGSSGSTIFDIHFTSSKTGFIIKSGKLYKTNDYGLNWYEVYNVYPGGNIIFTSQDTGYVVGGGTADCDPVPCNPPINYGAVIKTTDGGESWQKLTFFNDSLNIISASFIDNNFGYCFSSNNTIQKTEDGGLTWVSIDTGITGGSITGGLFINKSTGFIITNMGLIYITTNGGINWNLEYTASDGLFEIGGSNKMVVAGGNDGLICVRNLDNFQNWADNNAVWHYNQINFDTPPNQDYIKFTALGDTIIHEDTLKVILEENVSIDDTLSGNIYMKSDSNRVYYYIPEIKAYKLLYDFTAGPGDTLDVYCRQASNDSTIRIHIDSLSTIDVNGISLKVQHVSQIHSQTDEFWLEGEIIENIGWTGFMFPLHAWADPPYGGSLRCFQDDEAGLYKLTDTDCDYIAGSQPNAYKILIHEGKLWSNTVIPSMPGEYGSYWIKFEGDTIINGLEYKKHGGLKIHCIQNGI